MITSSQTAKASITLRCPENVRASGQGHGCNVLYLLITSEAETQDEARQAIREFVRELAALVDASS